MFVEQLSYEGPTQSKKASGLAVLCFLMGCPHVYGYIRQRSYRKSSFWVQKNISIMFSLMLGALIFLSI